jgi:hypothetical protein
MPRKPFLAALAAACATALISSAGSVALARADHGRHRPGCDKGCLLSVATAYTEALTINDVTGVTAAPTVRVTSNGDVTTLGHGEVWGPKRRIHYRQTFTDPETGSVLFLGTVTDDAPGGAATWWFYVARLKVEGRAITEVEEISTTRDFRGFDPNATRASELVLPDRTWDQVLPADEQSSREELMGVANNYWDWLARTRDWTQVPFGPDCQRTEDGTFTTNAAVAHSSCPGFFGPNGPFGATTTTTAPTGTPGSTVPAATRGVANRRFYIVDTERGVVAGFAAFTSTQGSTTRVTGIIPEIFKVVAGHVQLIEAFFRPEGQTHAGWGDEPS